MSPLQIFRVPLAKERPAGRLPIEGGMAQVTPIVAAAAMQCERTKNVKDDEKACYRGKLSLFVLFSKL